MGEANFYYFTCLNFDSIFNVYTTTYENGPNDNQRPCKGDAPAGNGCLSDRATLSQWNALGTCTGVQSFGVREIQVNNHLASGLPPDRLFAAGIWAL